MNFALPDESWVLLGVIRKAHGIGGELSLQSFSEKPEGMLHYSTVWLIATDGRISPPLNVERCRVQGKYAVLRLQGIETRSQAENCRGAGIIVRREQLPALAADEYYWHQLIGCRVELADGTEAGRAVGLFDNGAQDILVIDRGDGRESFVPVVAGIFLDHSADRIVIDPPPGLLEID